MDKNVIVATFLGITILAFLIITIGFDFGLLLYIALLTIYACYKS